MQYNAQTGKEIMQKYLGNDPKFETRLKHSEGVGDFMGKVARRIAKKNPELNLDVDLCDFLGYVHDIGYIVDEGLHQLYSIDLLIKEGVEESVAKKTMHGALFEDFEGKDDCASKYLPQGIEGVMLTYADMSVRFGEPMPIKERAAEMFNRIASDKTMPQDVKERIKLSITKAMPRFERYEWVILILAGAGSVGEF